MRHTLIIALLGFALLLTFGLATQSLPSGQFAQLDSGTGETYTPPPSSNTNTRTNTTSGSTNTTTNTGSGSTNTNTTINTNTNTGNYDPFGLDSGDGDVYVPPTTSGGSSSSGSTSNTGSTGSTNTTNTTNTNTSGAVNAGTPTSLPGTDTTGIDSGTGEVAHPPQETEQERLERLRGECRPDGYLEVEAIGDLPACDQELTNYCDVHGFDSEQDYELCRDIISTYSQAPVDPQEDAGKTTRTTNPFDPFKSKSPVDALSGEDATSSASGTDEQTLAGPGVESNTNTENSSNTNTGGNNNSVVTTNTDQCAGLSLLKKLLCYLPNGNDNDDTGDSAAVSVTVSPQTGVSVSTNTTTNTNSNNSTGATTNAGTNTNTTTNTGSNTGTGTNTSGSTTGTGSPAPTKVSSAVPLPDDDFGDFGTGSNNAGGTTSSTSGTQQAVTVVDVEIVDESEFVEAPPTIGSAQTEDQQIAPEPRVSFNQNYNDLHGEVKIFVRVADATGVEAMLRKPGTLTSNFLLRFKRSGDGVFTAVWNTTNSPNGQYELQLIVDNEFGEYKSQLRAIAVRNISALVDATETKAGIVNKIAAPTNNKLTAEDRADIDNRLTEVIRLTSIKDEVEAQGPTDFTREQLALNLSKRVQEFEDNALEKVIRTTLQSEQGDDVITVRAQLQTRKNELVQKPNRSIIHEKLAQNSKNQSSVFRAQLLQSPELLEEARVVEAISAVVDVDNDGLSNEEEIRRGTDMFNPDTDGDGFIDGLEVQNGFDPTIPSPGDRVVFEQPLQSGVQNDLDLGVATVQLVDVSDSPDFVDIRDKNNLTVLEDNSSTTGTVRVASLDRGKKVVLEGVCIPNSFCNIYIYSDPVVVTVRTDALGRWTYELDKDLDDGVHEAYVAITDNNGRVVEKSSPFSFVKTAQAIAVLDAAVTPEDRFEAIVDRGFTFQDFAVITLIVIIVAIILGLLILVIIARRARPLT